MCVYAAVRSHTHSNLTTQVLLFNISLSLRQLCQHLISISLVPQVPELHPVNLLTLRLCCFVSECHRTTHVTMATAQISQKTTAGLNRTDLQQPPVFLNSHDVQSQIPISSHLYNLIIHCL